jgi:ApaG protein
MISCNVNYPGNLDVLKQPLGEAETSAALPPQRRRRYAFAPPRAPGRLDRSGGHAHSDRNSATGARRGRQRDRLFAMYQECTRSIQISVEPFYLDDQSAPDQNRFVFGYRVQIENQGGEVVQLIGRHWRITDSLGRTMEVRGAGVVGKQPVLQPGESFEYTSGTPLATPSGIMVGSYSMVTTGGDQFEVAIPAFSLDAPGTPTPLN